MIEGIRRFGRGLEKNILGLKEDSEGKSRKSEKEKAIVEGLTTRSIGERQRFQPTSHSAGLFRFHH